MSVTPALGKAHWPVTLVESMSTRFTETLSQKIRWEAIEEGTQHQLCPPVHTLKYTPTHTHRGFLSHQLHHYHHRQMTKAVSES